MIVYLFISRNIGCDLSSATICGIGVQKPTKAEPLPFYPGYGSIMVAAKAFRVYAYAEPPEHWTGGEHGYGWGICQMSPAAAANLLMWLRDWKWTSDNIPVNLFEKWTRGKIYNTDLMQLERMGEQ